MGIKGHFESPGTWEFPTMSWQYFPNPLLQLWTLIFLLRTADRSHSYIGFIISQLYHSSDPYMNKISIFDGMSNWNFQRWCFSLETCLVKPLELGWVHVEVAFSWHPSLFAWRVLILLHKGSNGCPEVFCLQWMWCVVFLLGSCRMILDVGCPKNVVFWIWYLWVVFVLESCWLVCMYDAAKDPKRHAWRMYRSKGNDMTYPTKWEINENHYCRAGKRICDSSAGGYFSDPHRPHESNQRPSHG